MLKLLVLRHLKQSNILILPESHLKYLQIFRLCVAYTIIAPFSGKSLFLKVRREGTSKVSNFAVKKICTLLQGSCFRQRKLATVGELEFTLLMHAKS